MLMFIITFIITDLIKMIFIITQLNSTERQSKQIWSTGKKLSWFLLVINLRNRGNQTDILYWTLIEHLEQLKKSLSAS